MGDTQAGVWNICKAGILMQATNIWVQLGNSLTTELLSLATKSAAIRSLSLGCNLGNDDELKKRTNDLFFIDQLVQNLKLYVRDDYLDQNQ